MLATSRSAMQENFGDRTERELTILLYHGVTNSPSAGIENYSGKHIPADDFAHQMQTIRRHCTVLSMDDIVELTLSGKPFPARAVAVSFDDGFANNCTVAAPILDDLKVPAVFYISSGIVNTTLMFWVDELEACLNLTQASNIALALDTPRTFSLAAREDRIAALETIKQFCKRSPSAVKNRVLAELKTATGVAPAVEQADNYRKITWDQMRTMAENPLFTLGGHSLYHDILSELPPEQMMRDVNLSIDLLNYHLDRPIEHYSYPEGQAHHYNDAVIDVLKQRGIVCSPSAIHGLNSAGTDLFHLKRVMVGFLNCPFPFIHLVG